ncbi:hypothetical protein H5410_042661 [Solanum commersonii]|uniref:Uncharacterized protein n=1 Tax=Solanum commersonii TaxID=4109 RepID=A0A9J5XV07_SOLCO|nr:hypothetical protein H5410_042661 [Solanum commersonii]
MRRGERGVTMVTTSKNIMDALSSYMMSLFPIPTKVIKRLDAIRRNFLWQRSEDKIKYHFVKWEELLNGWKQSTISFYTANGQINCGRCSSIRERSS